MTVNNPEKPLHIPISSAAVDHKANYLSMPLVVQLGIMFNFLSGETDHGYFLSGSHGL